MKNCQQYIDRKILCCKPIKYTDTLTYSINN